MTIKEIVRRTGYSRGLVRRVLATPFGWFVRAPALPESEIAQKRFADGHRGRGG